MKRTITLVFVAICASLGVAAGAPARSTLEVFGVGAGDTIAVDNQPVVIKTGVAHAFSGQPLPGDAPAITLLTPGAHDVTLHREGCAPRSFTVEVQGAYQRTIVVAPAVTAHCATPALPPRAQ